MGRTSRTGTAGGLRVELERLEDRRLLTLTGLLSATAPPVLPSPLLTIPEVAALAADSVSSVVNAAAPTAPAALPEPQAFTGVVGALAPAGGGALASVLGAVRALPVTVVSDPVLTFAEAVPAVPLAVSAVESLAGAAVSLTAAVPLVGNVLDLTAAVSLPDPLTVALEVAVAGVLTPQVSLGPGLDFDAAIDLPVPLAGTAELRPDSGLSVAVSVPTLAGEAAATVPILAGEVSTGGVSRPVTVPGVGEANGPAAATADGASPARAEALAFHTGLAPASGAQAGSAPTATANPASDHAPDTGPTATPGAVARGGTAPAAPGAFVASGAVPAVAAQPLLTVGSPIRPAARGAAGLSPAEPVADWLAAATALAERLLDALPNADTAREETAAGEPVVLVPVRFEGDRVWEGLSPEMAGLLLAASPLGLPALLRVLEEFLDELNRTYAAVLNLLQRLGPWPWLLMGLALTATLYQLAREYRRRLPDPVRWPEEALA